MPHHCKLLLDNYTGHYLAGSSIQGRVLLNLNSDVSVRGVRIKLICNEHTEWEGTESYYDSHEKSYRTRTTQFTGDKEVLCQKQWLYGDQHSTTTLSAGQHIYPFMINLQQNIPGTYHCDKGSITYEITATVDRPMAPDYEDQVIIMVKAPVDLNFIARPSDLQPSSYSDEKIVCCWCCAQEPITMDLELPKLTLVPGEQQEVKMRLTNMSNTNVEGVSFELRQKISYRVTDPSRDDEQDSNILVYLEDVGLGAHGENTYIFNISLPPDVELPNFAQCGLFSVKYVYKAVAKLPSIHQNLEIEVNPKVGHIPLGGPRSGQTQHNSSSPMAQGVHPPVGWAAEPGRLNPSAPPLSDAKEPEATGYLANNTQAPPSYDTLNFS